MLILVTAAALALGNLTTVYDVSASGVSAGEYATATTESTGYDAIVNKGRRKAPSGVTMLEDRHLPSSGRRLLISGTRDLVRNFCLVHWAIRRHLDYVASFRFEILTGNEYNINVAEFLI